MKDFKIPFRTVCQSFPVGEVRRTEVRLGSVVLTFHGDVLYSARNSATNDGYYWKELPVISLGHYEGMHKVSYQELLFHLNRMLWEQSKNIIEPIVNEALGGENGDD